MKISWLLMTILLPPVIMAQSPSTPKQPLPLYAAIITQSRAHRSRTGWIFAARRLFQHSRRTDCGSEGNPGAHRFRRLVWLRGECSSAWPGFDQLQEDDGCDRGRRFQHDPHSMVRSLAEAKTRPWKDQLHAKSRFEGADEHSGPRQSRRLCWRARFADYSRSPYQ